MTLRKLVNDNGITQRMINAKLTIDSPAYQYFGEDALNNEVESRLQQLKKADYNRRLPVRHRTRTQMEEEKQELEIAEEINNIQTMQDLTRLLREGQLKEFYRRANILLKVRRANPVVTKIQRVDEQGEVAVYDDKLIVEKQIAEYFTEIYRRPQHMHVANNEIDFNVEEDEDM